MASMFLSIKAKVLTKSYQARSNPVVHSDIIPYNCPPWQRYSVLFNLINKPNLSFTSALLSIWNSQNLQVFPESYLLIVPFVTTLYKTVTSNLHKKWMALLPPSWLFPAVAIIITVKSSFLSPHHWSSGLLYCLLARRAPGIF